MTKISFVYFDVGGVIVKDFSETSHWAELKKLLGVKKEQEQLFDETYDYYEEEMCKGIDDKTLMPKFNHLFNIQFPPNFTFTKYIVDNFAVNTGIHKIIYQVKNSKKIGLLTDMYYGMRKYMVEKNLFPKNITYDLVIDSSELGVKKPMSEIYQIAKERAGVPAEEILFIDNRQKNLDVPAKMGWQTYLYDSSDYTKSNQALAEFVSLNL